MIKTLTAAALVAVISAPAATAQGYTEGGHARIGQKVVTASCYRGPWTDVIIDAPNPVFIDSLVNAGYSYGEAQGLATRICRDPSLVGRSGSLVAATARAINARPPR